MSSWILVHGGWSEGSFSACYGRCGEALRSKKKQCDNPTPSKGGKKCPCNDTDVNCNGITATVDEVCDDAFCKYSFFCTFIKFITFQLYTFPFMVLTLF